MKIRLNGGPSALSSMMSPSSARAAVLVTIFAMSASYCSAVRALVMAFVLAVASTLLVDAALRAVSLAVLVSGAPLDCLVLCSAASAAVSPRIGSRLNMSKLMSSRPAVFLSTTPLSITAAPATNSLVHM